MSSNESKKWTIMMDAGNGSLRFPVAGWDYQRAQQYILSRGRRHQLAHAHTPLSMYLNNI